MTFELLALICAVGLAGPLLALRKSWHLPVVLGELLAGIVLGRTVLGVLNPADQTFTFLAEAGFALVMFVAGTHVPMRNTEIRPAVRRGAVRAIAVGVAAAAIGYGLAGLFGTHHGAIYAVLLASSSAALILPIVDSVGLGGGEVISLLPQIAIADAACIVALPLAMDPSHALRAGLGALALTVVAALIYAVFSRIEAAGIRREVHDLSEERGFAIELRTQLAMLFAMAALAIWLHVSIMLAGFAFGLAVSAVGTPRRLANQLFALTEGLLGPVFFTWLGATLDLRALAQHPALVGLGVGLGLAAVVAHVVVRLFGQPLPLGLLAAAQLGVPVAAVTIGTQQGNLVPGEGAAMMLGALVTIAIAVLGGSWAARAGLVSPVSTDA